MTTRKKETRLQRSSERILDFIAYNGQARAFDLQRALSISNVAIHKQLRKLVHLSKIKRVGTPPFVLYVLPEGNEKNVIQLEKIKRKVYPILKKAFVKKAVIFGSYARGDNTNESDIDMLVDLPTKATL